MAEIKVPELAESITEGTIAQWLKHPGDHVDKGEYIVELETDKVNVEVISEEEGVVQSLLFEEGDTVQVGDVIAIVGEGTGENNATPSAPPKEAEAPQPAQAPNRHKHRRWRKHKRLPRSSQSRLRKKAKAARLLLRLPANWHVKKALTYRKCRQWIRLAG